ncbi:tRNA nuclease WapA precursor [Mucilaginibacter gotjawali]|nr:tRNA nuclease WapA precursor [Mucilaginibacter gotjawali]
MMGNITTLSRLYNNVLIDSLNYNYLAGTNATNQLKSVTDLSADASGTGYKTGTGTYVYDANGNLTADNSKGLNISYNLLNLPNAITGNKTITYTYSAAGEKLRRISPNTGVTDYVAGIQYEDNNTGTSTIAFIQTEEGKAVPLSTGGYDYQYYLGDNLGNTRVTFSTKTSPATAVQTDNYLPFGTEISRGTITNPKNEYLYNKKELQEELGEYDYGARFYDPVIARWTTIDAYAEHPDQIDFSPYHYVKDNPIRYNDPDGNCPICLVWGAELIEAGLVAVGIVGTAAIIVHSHIQHVNSNGSPVMQQSTIERTPIVQARTLSPPGSRAGKPHTPAGKKKVIDDNKAANDGKTICQGCGVETTKPEKSQKGVTPPTTDTQVDHIDPQANGGSGTTDNGQVLCRGCNIDKSDKVPAPAPPAPAPPPPPPHQ